MGARGRKREEREEGRWSYTIAVQDRRARVEMAAIKKVLISTCRKKARRLAVLSRIWAGLLRRGVAAISWIKKKEEERMRRRWM